MTMSLTPASAKGHQTGGLSTYFACLRAAGSTIVSAHRGAPGAGIAENTLAAFAALPDKREILAETDVQATRDGILVLNHDDSLDRTTTLSGAVRQHDWEEIRTARMRDASGRTISLHPSSLAELLDATRTGPVLQLDIKTGTPIESVLDVVGKASAGRRVIYLAYTDDDIAAILRYQPDAIISTVMPTMADVERVLALGVRSDHLQAMFFEHDIDRAYFKALREKGVTVMVAAITAEERTGGGLSPLSASRYSEIAASGAQILVSNFPKIARASLRNASSMACGSPMGS